MDSAKSQLVDRLKTANSVLITVSRNPSVDQLAACIGLTLLANKLGKHGSAVFSGEVPSTIEFLKPSETIEKTADSLRDFIIALDKNKADKLRYKVEDKMVKIFISPYKTSLSEKDLEFSQGDFNVDVVIALGVKQQDDLDQAIVSHGRILHDATVACINTTDQSNLGTINWQDPAASSLCELVTDLALALGDKLLDEQIATALLTGIIAETDRFSNQKTSSQTMNVSGQLMAAGANQQLVATNLAEPKADVKIDKDQTPPADSGKGDNGTLSISHENNDQGDLDLPTLPKPAEESEPPADSTGNPPRVVTQPPVLGGTLTANTMPEEYDPATDPLSNFMAPTLPPGAANPSTQAAVEPSPPPKITLSPTPAYTPPPPSWMPPAPPLPSSDAVAPPIAVVPPPLAVVPEPPKPIDTQPVKEQTLNDLEKAVDSPHLKVPDANAAREQIDAIRSAGPTVVPEPDLSINSLPLGQPLHEDSDNAKLKTATGLDPSLFSEPPKTDQAPPVPPPIKYPISGNQDDSGNPTQ